MSQNLDISKDIIEVIIGLYDYSTNKLKLNTKFSGSIKEQLKWFLPENIKTKELIKLIYHFLFLFFY